MPQSNLNLHAMLLTYLPCHGSMWSYHEAYAGLLTNRCLCCVNAEDLVPCDKECQDVFVSLLIACQMWSGSLHDRCRDLLTQHGQSPCLCPGTAACL
jgi:hypothetical protein